MSDGGVIGGDRLEQLAGRAVENTVDAGADQADVYCVDGIASTVRVYEGAIENLTEAGSRGVGVRAFVGGRSGYAYGPDLSDRGIERLARAACECAAVTEPDEHAGLPEACGITEVGKLASSSFSDWEIDRKVDLALEVERTARERDPLISNVEDTVYADDRVRVAIANSNGFIASFDRTQCHAYAYAFAGEGSELMTGIGVGTADDPSGLDPASIGAEAADRAMALHGARQPTSRRGPVVLDAVVAASFLGVIGSILSADAVQRGRSLFAGKEGERVASGSLYLLDDGTAEGGLATMPFDGEGMPTRRTELIRGGNLKTFLFDSYTARKVSRESTGNGQRGSYRAPPSVGRTNLVLEPGEATLDQLIEQAGDGVYVMGVTGLHSGVNAITGQFSVGATGRVIEGGRLGEAVREFTIASDLLSMLGGVEAIGSERRWLPFGGSVRASPMLIDAMAVAGS